MHLKIEFRAYLISHLRNAKVRPCRTFAIEKETHPNPPSMEGIQAPRTE